MAILRRSESHAHSQIASLNNTVQKLSIENGNLQRANEVRLNHHICQELQEAYF